MSPEKVDTMRIKNTGQFGLLGVLGLSVSLLKLIDIANIIIIGW